jgi:hypothetical protein
MLRNKERFVRHGVDRPGALPAVRQGPNAHLARRVELLLAAQSKNEELWQVDPATALSTKRF